MSNSHDVSRVNEAEGGPPKTVYGRRRLCDSPEEAEKLCWHDAYLKEDRKSVV